MCTSRKISRRQGEEHILRANLHQSIQACYERYFGQVQTPNERQRDPILMLGACLYTPAGTSSLPLQLLGSLMVFLDPVQTHKWMHEPTMAKDSARHSK